MADSSAATSTDRVAADLRRRHARLASGAALPTTRSIVERFGVSPVTVQAALRRLEAEGLVETRPGAGTFARRPVAERVGDPAWQTSALGPPSFDAAPLLELVAPRSSDGVTLSSGYLPVDLQPTGLLRAAATRATRRDIAWTSSPSAGLDELRAWFARQVGPRFQPADVVVTPGGQAGLATILRALVGPGDSVVVESPTYLGAITAMRAAGARIVPVAARLDGPDPDEVDRALRSCRARVLYVQPTVANPTGITWSADRRTAVLDVVRRRHVFVIEDGWSHDLVFHGTVPRPLALDDEEGHVLHLRSLTKVAAPSLRVAAIVGRGPVMRRLVAVRVVDDLFISSLLQCTAIELVTSAAWDRHRRRLLDELRLRQGALVSAVRSVFGDGALQLVPLGGFHLWVALNDGEDADALADRARHARLAVTSGSTCFPAEPTGQHLRLTFAASPPDVLHDGVRRLGRLRRM